MRIFRLCENVGIPLESEGSPGKRNLKEERQRWLVGSDEFPRRDELLDKYGWEGMSIGMMMQPANFPDVISKCDALDPQGAVPHDQRDPARHTAAARARDLLPLEVPIFRERGFAK